MSTPFNSRTSGVTSKHCAWRMSRHTEHHTARCMHTCSALDICLPATVYILQAVSLPMFMSPARRPPSVRLLFRERTGYALGMCVVCASCGSPLCVGMIPHHHLMVYSDAAVCPMCDAHRMWCGACVALLPPVLLLAIKQLQILPGVVSTVGHYKLIELLAVTRLPACRTKPSQGGILTWHDDQLCPAMMWLLKVPADCHRCGCCGDKCSEAATVAHWPG
jgi:hypothetical protein